MTIGNISQTITEVLSSRYTDKVSDSVQRLTSGLRINDAADDIGGLVTSSHLGSASSALQQGIENGNDGLALVQLSNKALDNQLDILNTIKEKLDVSKYDSTSSAGKDAIRLDIIDLITKLDDIASNVNYSNNYTLQKSDTDTDFSLSTTITLNNSTITTQSIQSNSDGLSLGTLKNLTAGGLTGDVSVAQLDVIDTAITDIDSYKNSFNLSQVEIEIAVENLTGIEKTTSESRDKILNTNEKDENAILEKYKLLEKSSEFAIVQANITQATVLRLLTDPVTVIDYGKDNKNSQIDINKPKADDIYTNNSSDYSDYTSSNYNASTFTNNSTSYENKNYNDTPSLSTNTGTDT